MSSSSNRLYISSSSNAQVKLLRKLATSAGARTREQQTVAHGPHLVASYLASGRKIAYYFVASSAIENDEVFALLDTLAAEGLRGIELPDSLYETLSDVHARVGISLVIPLPAQHDTLAPLAADSLLLETVQDPGNLGTILRTAAAAGVKNIYLSRDCASAWAPKTLRAGMGAQFDLELHEAADLAHVIETSTIPIYATTLADDSISLYDAACETPVAWLLGSEGKGVSAELQSLASARVHIPQYSQTVESLNVAAAAAICLYERARNR